MGRLDEITPGTQMGIVQASPSASDGKGSVFTISPGITVTIRSLNIRHGDAVDGGGINNAGTLALEGVTLYDNRAANGGGVYNTGAVTITNSTIVNDTATTKGRGGGIDNAANGKLTLIHTTLAGNGMNIYTRAISDTVVTGSILSGTGEQQCDGAISSQGGNLIHNGACDDGDPVQDRS